MSTQPKRYLILGTAGHIDHGKTSLVKRLTGIDTDRLPEEKQRGITIDLGFANLDLPGVTFGIVDVPGHERFVHNMVAGATGIDLAMLVVAADDSVMPQTTEHLAILQLLGVRAGLVALTKIDLVERDHIELALAELSDLLSGTFLAHAPIVPVSSVSGEGIAELQSQLARIANQYERPTRREVFRLPIDRVFTVQGHGTVVSGTVLSGSTQVGDTLVLMPQNQPVRVRRLQSHGSDRPVVQAGQRAAINLVGVKNDELRRGDELTVAGYLQPTQRILARVEVLRSFPRPLVDRQLVRLHLATREITARVVLKGGSIKPGESGYVELRSRDVLLADYGQRFILRQLSPVLTLGGGVVLDPGIARHQRIPDLASLGERLSRPESTERLAAFLEHTDIDALTPTALAWRLGVDPAQRDILLAQLSSRHVLVRLTGPNGPLVSRTRRERLAGQIVTRCQRELKRRQPSRALDRHILIAACQRLADTPIIDAMVNDLVAQGRLVKVGDKIGPAGQRAQLTRNQQKWQAELIQACRDGGLAPPMLAELAKQIGQSVKELEVLAQIAAEDDILVRIADGLYVDPASLERARQLAIERLTQNGPATVAELRDAWGVSRKYAVPYCEYFDAAGITDRSGDTRTLGPKAHQPIVNPAAAGAG
jgi:selenocysteine-specific elongation factor